MEAIYMGNNRLYLKTQNGFPLIVPGNDLSMSVILLNKGTFEPAFANYLIQHLKQGNTVVDVGTNVGYFTVLMGLLVGPNGKVLAYEANPKIVEFLKYNILINGTDRITQVVPKGVYSKEGTIRFNVTKNASVNSSIYEHDAAYLEYDEYDVLEIQTEKLDSRLKAYDHIDLLKIDIEGGEMEAFKGMKETIERNAIDKIVFEWNKSILKEKHEEFINVLSEMSLKTGKSFYLLDQANSHLVPTSLDILRTIDWFPHVFLQ